MSNTNSENSAAPFVVLEGIDGAGTTTQAKRLAALLRRSGQDVLVTAEPSTGPIGRQIRTFLNHDATTTPDALALMFAADRRHHLAYEIEPALRQGTWVIADRYVISSLAYQSLECPLEWVQTLNQGVREPDATLFLDLPLEAAHARRAGRAGDEELFEGDETLARVQQHYRALLGENAKVGHIDASQDMEHVGAQIEAYLSRTLPQWTQR